MRLTAVTPGVDVHALTRHAEQALLELSRKQVPADRFAELAAELSNCPSGARGGDLGWIGPEDCAPELANELFHQKHAQWGMGLPRAWSTRASVSTSSRCWAGARAGRRRSSRCANASRASSPPRRARALHQYMRLLVGQAQIEGVALEGADSPLVQ